MENSSKEYDLHQKAGKGEEELKRSKEAFERYSETSLQKTKLQMKPIFRKVIEIESAPTTRPSWSFHLMAKQPERFPVLEKARKQGLKFITRINNKRNIPIKHVCS